MGFNSGFKVNGEVWQVSTLALYPQFIAGPCK